MYQIFFDDYPIYDPRDEELLVFDPDVHLAVGEAGEMSFSIGPTHPYLSKLTRTKGVLELRSGGLPIFKGRIRKDTRGFDMVRQIEVEGLLACLNDSIIPPFEFPGDFQEDPAYQAAAASGNVVAFFLGWLLDQHNEQVRPAQQIQLGTVTVADPNNYISRASSEYLPTMDVVRKKLEDLLGGYLVADYSGETTVLHYYDELPLTNTQTVDFGRNLLDLVSALDATEYYTAILPIGKDGLTLAELPDGEFSPGVWKDGLILYSQDAEEAAAARIIRKVEWKDVTLATNLRTKAAAMMTSEGIRTDHIITVKAADLGPVENVGRFAVGRMVQLESAPHGLLLTYPLMELDPNILDPADTEITLGGRLKTASGLNHEGLAATQERLDQQQLDFQGELKATERNMTEVIEGLDGLFFYVKYSAYADGSSMTDTPQANTQYMGTCSAKLKQDTAPTDPAAYTWVKIKGEQGIQGVTGVGVKAITNYYLVTASGSGVTTSTSGWTTTVPAVSLSKKYLWNYEKVTYTDNTEEVTTPCIIGVYGDTGPTGATGIGISSISERYAVSTSNTTAPTSWLTSVPTMTATNKYLWNYEIVTYTNGSTAETSKRVIGVYGDKGNTGDKGDKGDTGVGVKSITNYYLASVESSGVTTSTAGWTTTVQAVTRSQKYLWNYEKVTYTDGTAAATTPCIIGTYGDTGATGTGISSIAERYAVSTSNTTAPTSWQTSVPTLTATNKYLWNYEIITYTNGSTAETSKRVIGVYGDKGEQGDTGVGVKSTSSTYQASASGTTPPTGTWSASPPAVSPGQYLWTRTIMTYTDGTSSTSYSVGRSGENGAKGDTGEAGPAGADGRTQYLHIKYSDDGETFTADNGETLGAWIGTLVDFVELDSTNFDDYTWKKFTEDVDDELEGMRQTFSEQITSVVKNTESILLSSLSRYVETSRFSEFQQTVSAELQVLSDNISLRFTEATEQIENVNGDLQKTMETLSKHFEFNIDGLTIKAGEKAMSLKLDNGLISFEMNGQQFGWWDGVDFHTGNIVVDVNERAQFGNFAAMPRSSGNLSWKKVRS